MIKNFEGSALLAGWSLPKRFLALTVVLAPDKEVCLALA